jgi:hypothetical protein
LENTQFVINTTTILGLVAIACGAVLLCIVPDRRGNAQPSAIRAFLKALFILPAAFIGVMAVGLILLVVFGTAYGRLVPSDSQEIEINEIDTKLRLDLYVNNPFGKAEFDRRLVVTSPQGTISRDMQLDWGGATRTSIYLTPDRQIAILGPAGDDYLVSLDPLQIVPLFRQQLDSDSWKYLGVFDRGDTQYFTLRFYSASEQTECVPTLMHGGTITSFRIRASKTSCSYLRERRP